MCADRSASGLRGDANRELEQLQRTFNRFAPARIVDDILEKRSLDVTETREVTMLFADLRGFTALSECMEAPDLVALLNTYFQRMDRAVDEHGGVISKFIGDRCSSPASDRFAIRYWEGGKTGCPSRERTRSLKAGRSASSTVCRRSRRLRHCSFRSSKRVRAPSVGGPFGPAT